MFDDTIISILGNEPKNTPLKSVLADVQEFDGEIEIDNLKFNVYKRLYIDYVEPLIYVNTHIKVDNEVLKVVKVNKYSDYLEIFVKNIKDIKVNGIDKTVIIEDNADKIIDYKIIISDFKINTGDLVEYQGTTWLVIGEVEQGKNSYRGTIRRLDHTIKIYINNILHEIPCTIEAYQQGVEQGRYIVTGKGNLRITVQDDNITNKIAEDMRIIKWGYAWKVIAKTAENKGLRYIFLEKSSINTATDDLQNEIADRWKYETKHDYSMTITEENINIQEGKTKQLIVKITDTVNSEVKTLENPNIVYSSDNEAIVTVDNKGIITGIKEGITNIKVKFENVEKIINVKVDNTISPTNYYKIQTGSTNCPPYIKWGRQTECSINYYKDNIAQSNAFEFSLTDVTNNNSTQLAKIISKENNKCIIQANSEQKSGQIILHCKDNTNNNVIDRTIDIQSLWSTEKHQIQSINIDKSIATVGAGKDLQLNVNAKNESFEYKEPNIFFVSDNPSIATVNEIGKITGVGEGVCNISVYTLDMAITDIIKITVVKNVELTITGRDSIAIGRPRTYTSNIPVNWSIEDVDNDGKVIKPWVWITSQTDTSVTVQATDKWLFNDNLSKYFKIIASDKNNSNNVAEKKIKIVSY